MVPGQFESYFTAMAGAGGTLIGLLFVAISLNPERTFGRNAPHQRRVVAMSAFTALATAFLVCGSALLPADTLGPFTLLLSAAALAEALSAGVQLAREHLQEARAGRTVAGGGARSDHLWLQLTKVLTFTGVACLIYGVQFWAGLTLTLHPHDTGALLTIGRLVIAMNGLGMLRAWQLLGASGRGIQGLLLTPLTDLDEAARPDSAPPSAPPSAPLAASVSSSLTTTSSVAPSVATRGEPPGEVG